MKESHNAKYERKKNMKERKLNNAAKTASHSTILLEQK